MELSIIIPTHNRSRTLGTTLRSLIDQDFGTGRYEIVVVDNNSRDRTPELVREFQATSPVPIRYRFEARPGVHYARNWGAVHARGEMLYYTDDDMCAEPDMLSNLLGMFALDKNVATATGRVLPRWECEPPGWIRRYCENGLLSLQLRPEESLISTEDMGVFSCHQAIRRDALLECGGFNPENTGGEWVGDGESGLNLKLRARGYKFAYTAKAVTHHLIPPERMTQRYLNRRLANQGSSDAFTWFREQRPDARSLARAQAQCVWGGVRESVALAASLLARREDWRLRRAQLSYFRARFQYAGRLRRDANWREFVLRDNWIEAAD